MKVSIITVCFNSANTIEQAIQSILCQTYSDIEHIVVDGGSMDGTLEVIGRYKNSISKLVSERDSGIYDAMNKGLNLATGDIVGFLNADDFYADKGTIEQIATAVQDNNTDCCYGDLEYVDRNDHRKIVRRWKSRPYQDGLFEKGWHPPHPTFFVKRSVIEQYGCFNLNYNIAADYELMLRLLRKIGVKSCYIPVVLVKMRIGGESNKNLIKILKANVQCYLAWRENGLRISPFSILRKPLSKLAQYLWKD